jgi:predicted metal-dependent hydrolase
VTAIPPPEAPPPRRSDKPLPAHRYLPGERPHPRELGWEAAADFAYAADLFDHRHYWEAHEVWESEWRTLDRDSEEAWLLQGLICGAAFVIKQHQGIEDGAERLLARCHHCLRAVVDRQGPVVRGYHLPELFRRLHGFRETGEWPVLPPA